MQKACFEHSPLGNLLSKKLKVSGDSDNVGDKKDDGKVNDGDDNISDNKSDVRNLNDLTDQSSVDDIFYSARSELSPKLSSVSPEQIVDNIDNELSDDNKNDNKSDAQDLIDQYETDEEYLAKLDELLNGLKDNEEFLKDFKTNMDNIDNEQANKNKQEKLKAIELIENLRDDFEKEMKYTKFLKQKGREAIDLIDEIKSEHDELKDNQTKNLDILNKLKKDLINLPKPVFTLTPAPRPIKRTELSTQTDPIFTPRPIQQGDLQIQTISIPSTRPIQQSDLQTQTELPTELPTQSTQSTRTPFV